MANKNNATKNKVQLKGVGNSFLKKHLEEEEERIRKEAEEQAARQTAQQVSGPKLTTMKNNGNAGTQNPGASAINAWVGKASNQIGNAWDNFLNNLNSQAAGRNAGGVSAMMNAVNEAEGRSTNSTRNFLGLVNNRIPEIQEKTRKVGDAWDNFLNNLNNPEPKPKAEYIVDPKGYLNGNLPESRTYGQEKDDGNRAGWGNFLWMYNDNNRNQISPEASREQSTYASLFRNKGLYDDQTANPYMWSDDKMAKQIAELEGQIEGNRQRTAGQDRQLEGEDAGGYLDDEGMTAQDRANELMQLTKDWGRLPFLYYRNGVPIQDAPKEYDEQLGQGMFQYIYGEDAFAKETAANDGKLSEESEERMRKLWEGSLPKDEQDYIEFQNRALQQEVDNLKGIQQRQLGYENLIGENGDWAATNDVEAGYRADVDNYNPSDIFGTDKAAALYNFFGDDTVLYQTYIKNGNDSLDRMDRMASAFDHAYFYTPKEKAIFQEYMNANDKEGALAFHQGLVDSRVLANRYMEWKKDTWRMMSDITPITSGAATVAGNKLGAVMGAAGQALKLAGVDAVDHRDSAFNTLTAQTQTMRENIAQNAGDDIYKLTGSEFLRKLASTATNSIFSGIDSGTDYAIGKWSASLLGNLGLIKPSQWRTAAEAASLGNMFLEVFQNSYYQNLEEKPDDPDYARISGLLDAAQEVFWETVGGVDFAFKEGQQAWKYGLGMMLGEIIEEEGGAVSSPIVNSLKDNIYKLATTGETDWNMEWDDRAMELYRSNPEKYAGEDGMKQAYHDVLTGYVAEMGWTAVGTLFSTAPKAVGAGAGMYGEYAERGKRITENGQLDTLAEMAAQSEDAEIRKRGEAIQEKQKSGKKTPNREIGSLWAAMAGESETRLSEEKAQQMQRSIRGFLRDTYGDRVGALEQKQLTEIAAKAAEKGVKALNLQERRMLDNHAAVKDLVNDLTSEKGPDSAKRSAGMLESAAAETEERTSQIRETMDKLASMAESGAEKLMRTISRSAENVLKNAKNAMDTATARTASTEEASAASLPSPGPEKSNRGMAVYDVENEETGETAKSGGEILRKEGNQYVIRTAEGNETKVDAANVKAGDEVTAAAMNFAEYSGMDDQTATDLLDVVKDEAVTGKNVESVLRSAKDMMIRGWLQESVPDGIGYDPKIAEKLYSKGAIAARDAEARRQKNATGKSNTLNPGNGKVEYRGVEKESLSGPVRSQVEAVEALAKKVGFNVIFENDEKNKNRFGEYDPTNGSVIINLAGKNRNNIGHHLLVTLGHELTHLLENSSGEGYAQLKAFVFGEMRKNGANLAARVQAKMDNYNLQIAEMRRHGENVSDITVGGSIAEVVADACDQVLSDEKLIRRMAEDNPSLYTKVKNFVEDFTDRIRKAVAGMRGSRSVESLFIPDLEKLAQKWGVALEEVQGKANPAIQTNEVGDASNNDMQYSFTEVVRDDKTIEENKKKAAGMEPVVIAGNQFEYGTDTLQNDLYNYYKEHRHLPSKVFGVVNVSNSSIKSSIYHGMSELKAALYESLPGVIQNGELVSYNEKWDGRKYNSGILSAPVTIKEGPLKGDYFVGAIIHSHQDGQNTYYTHDGVAAIINNSDGSILFTDNGGTSPVATNGRNLLPGESPEHRYMVSILTDIANYNSKSGQTQKSLADAREETGYQDENMARAAGAQDTNGQRLFSLASMEHDRELYYQMLSDNGILSQKEIDGLFDTIDLAMETIRGNRMILDLNERGGKDDRAFSPVKPNSDPLYRVSLDFSTLCRKRLLQQALQEMIEKKYKTVMTKAERVAMRNALQELQKEGKRIEIACALCYVESARLKSPAQIQRFMSDKRGQIVDYLSKNTKGYKQQIDEAEAAMKVALGYDANTSLKAIKKDSLSNERAIRAMKKRMYKEYKPSATEEALIRAAETMDESMFKTAEGLAKLKRDYPLLFDAYTTSIRNATKSKGIESDVPFYAGDTRDTISDDLIRKMNAENGLRSQSWSDFQVYHILDYIGAIMELSTRKAKMQAYTKVPDYARLMGKTGQMINLSLIPTDYNGELGYDPNEGMPFETAQELRDQYPDTVGNICIGISDDHIRALLASDDIDYVIPYHKSSMDKETRQKIGLKNWDEYEAQQNEKDHDYPEADENSPDFHRKPEFSEWFNYREAVALAEGFRKSGISMREASKMAMQEMANRYIDLCHQRGLQEKFANFSNNDGYWKLLIDRKMINQISGEIIEQQAVRPIFDSDTIQQILKDEVARVKETQPDIDAATEEIMKKWENGEIRKAAKTKAVQDTVRAFDDRLLMTNIIESANFTDQGRTAKAMSLAELEQEYEEATAEGNKDWQAMVVQRAAHNAGYTTGAYHGSPITDITEFNTRSGEMKKQNLQLLFGTHFTQDKRFAELYARKAKNSKGTSRMTSKTGKVYDVYLDLGKSLDLRTAKNYTPDSEMFQLYNDLPANIKRKNKPFTFSAYDTEQGLGSGEYITARHMEDALQAMSPKDATEFLVDHGYNSVLYMAAYNLGSWDNNRFSRDPSIIMLDPERIKSAEPETHDDQGNVIPLSERFDASRKDIRYSLAEMDDEYLAAAENGNEEAASRMVERAAKAAGYTTPKLYHGTGAFGFTKFDLEMGEQLIFATTDRKIGETYSGETSRSRIHERTKLDVGNLHGEELLNAAKENLGKYKDYRLATAEDREEILYEPKQSLTRAISRITEYAEENKNAFDKEKKSIVDRIVKSLEEIAKATDSEQMSKAWNEYDSAVWDLKWMDESIQMEMIDARTSNDINSAYRRLSEALYDGDIFVKDDPFSLEYVFDNQIANELGSYLHQGVYELYGRPGNQLVIDAEGRNWNSIMPPDELGMYGPQKTRDIAAAAKAHNYDSVLIKNLRDSGGATTYNSPSDVYIFFDANDVKSADPVTYDEQGKVIPLSERFNTENTDIRYSLADTDSGEQIDDALFSMADSTPSANDWMMWVDVEDLRDAEEKRIVNSYRARVADADQTRQQIQRMQRQLKQATGDEARKLKINLQTEQNKLQRQEDAISTITSSAKWAKMLQDTQKAIDTYLTGQTQEQVDKSIKLLKEQAKSAEKTSAARSSELQRTIKFLESRSAQRLMEEQMKWRDRIQNDRNARNLAERNMATRRQINTTFNRLAQRLINETDERNVPEQFKAVVRAALRPILENDAGGHRHKITGADLTTLKEQLRVLRAMDLRDGTQLNLSSISEDEDIQDAITAALEDIQAGIQYYNSDGRVRDENGRVISSPGRMAILQGNQAALERIRKGISQIWDIVHRSNQAFINGKYVEVSNVAYEVETDAKKRGVYKEFAGTAGKAANSADRGIRLGNFTPWYFFKRLKNNGLSMLYNEMGNGENRYGLLMNEMKKRVEAIAEKASYGTWDLQKKTSFKLQSGKTVSMTVEQIMSLMATWKRENTLGPEMSQHLLKGGFVYEEEADKMLLGRHAQENTPYRVTAEDIEQIIGSLTDEQKAYVDDMVGLLSTRMSELGNEASMRMYGIKKYNETYYFPFQVWDGVKNKTSNAGSQVNPTNNNRAAHQGWTKRRTANASNALMLEDFTKACAQHMTQMITYSTMGTTIENMNRVLNFRITEREQENNYDPNLMKVRNIESLLTERYGKNAVDYIRTFLQDINGGAVQDRRNSIQERLLGLFRKNAVAGSLSVSLQQPLSYIRAAMMINPMYLGRSINPTYWKGSYQEMMEHSGVAVIKDMGRFDMNYGRTGAEFLTPEAKKTKGRAVYDWISDKSTVLPEIMDRMTWTRMWSACKIEQHSLHPEMDMRSKEFLDMVGQRFNEVMRGTQVYDSVLVKSSNMRSSKYTMKTMTSFMAEPTLTANMLYDAFADVKEKGGVKKAAGAAGVYILGAVLQAAVKGIMSAGRSPDEKKTLWENFLIKFFTNFLNESNPMNLIPGYSTIVEAMSGSSVSDNALGVIKTITADVPEKAIKALTGDGRGAYRDLEDTAGQVAQLFTGVPARNIMRDMRAMYNWVLGNYADRETSGTVIKYAMKDAMATEDLIGAINDRLNAAGLGYDTGNSAYYERIYEAEKRGEKRKAEELREYMTAGKGAKEETIRSKVKSFANDDKSLTGTEKVDFLYGGGYTERINELNTSYKAGEITQAEYKAAYRKYFPDKEATDAELYWKLDELDYQKKHGSSDGYSKYARFDQAVKDKSLSGIRTATKELMKNNTVKDIKATMKSSCGGYIKPLYMAAASGSQDEVTYMNLANAVLEEAGYTKAEREKYFGSWKKEKQKGKK